MTCPKCAALLKGADALCPRCGEPILEEDRTIRPALECETIEFLGWILLFVVSSLLVIPLAWTIAAVGRWFCRNLRLRGGETVAFGGKGLEILGWILLSFVVGGGCQAPFRLGRPLSVGILFGGVTILSTMIQFMILRWIVSNLELSNGPPLQFDGSYWGWLGYQVLIAASGITIIGWAWALSSYYGWIAEHTRGKNIEFHCDTEGWDILWRTVAAALGSIPIVTIPWVWLWYTRWLVSCVSFTRLVADYQPEWA